MKILDESFALYGDEGCIVYLVKRDDGEGWDFSERHPDSQEDAVSGVVRKFDNEKVEYLGSSMWVWVTGTDPTSPGDCTRQQITVVGPVNLLKKAYGHWDEITEFPVADWRAEVDNGDTQLGYLDWVENEDGKANA